MLYASWRRDRPALFSLLLALLLQLIKAKELSELHIGSMFPMEAGAGGWPGGQACLPAVEMALHDINNSPDILPGFHLKSHNHNTKCQPGLAAKQLYELLYKPPVKLMLITGCSPVTTVVAEAVPVWNLIVLSYGASSPALSNRDRFPTLFRTHPSANMQNPTRIRIFEKFRWSKITILQSVEEVFTSTAKDLEEQCRQHNIRVERQSFYGDPRDAIKTLVRQDARIIVGLFYVTEARRVLCQAYKHGLYGKKYVWFFIGWYADEWYIPPKDESINCTAEQMKEAAQYHFTTESIMLSRDNQPAISGMTGKQFQERLNKKIETEPANTGGYPEAPLAYDAVWALALALNCTQNSLPEGVRLEDFTYNNKVIADQLFDCVKNTQFKGVSGQVMFSDSGDRIARSQIEQMQDGKYVMLGYYDATIQKLDWFDKEKFAGDGKPPPDSLVIKENYMTVRLELFIIVALMAVIGAILSMGTLIFNINFGYRGVIIQSQPQCNIMLIVGCVFCLLNLLLMGLPVDNMTIPKGVFTLFCYSKLSLLNVGFTLAYGSMFAKVWIVHRMGTRENQEVAAAKEEPIPAIRFYVVVGCLLAVDLILTFLWLVIDPLQRKVKKFSLQEPQNGPTEDIRLLPVLEYCESEHQDVWTIIFLGYKGLLLLFGLFLAYESKNLKIRFVNDIRFVCFALYNVAVFCLVTGPVSTLLLKDQPNSNFLFVSGAVLWSTFISLGLVFVPKVLYIYKTPASKDMARNGNESKSSMSKSEHLRYEQLVKENRELKRQIETRENKINECRKVLEKKLGTAVVAPMISNNNEIKQFKETDTLCSPTTPISYNNNFVQTPSSIIITHNNISSFASEEPATQSTVFTTTALIETREITEEETAACSEFDNEEEEEDDDQSTCSNEILL